MAAGGLEIYCKVCTVDAVDETARTVDCSPLDESAPLLGVNLQANQDGEYGIVTFPAVGSYVAVAFISQSVAIVVLCEQVDKIEVKIGDQTIKMTSEGVVFNGGALGGMVKVGELTTKLNTLEYDINTLKSIFSAWVAVPQDGGAALQLAAMAWASSSLTATQETELEDEKVKH